MQTLQKFLFYNLKKTLKSKNGTTTLTYPVEYY